MNDDLYNKYQAIAEEYDAMKFTPKGHCLGGLGHDWETHNMKTADTQAVATGMKCKRCGLENIVPKMPINKCQESDMVVFGPNSGKVAALIDNGIRHGKQELQKKLDEANARLAMMSDAIAKRLSSSDEVGFCLLNAYHANSEYVSMWLADRDLAIKNRHFRGLIDENERLKNEVFKYKGEYRKAHPRWTRRQKKQAKADSQKEILKNDH